MLGNQSRWQHAFNVFVLILGFGLIEVLAYVRTSNTISNFHDRITNDVLVNREVGGRIEKNQLEILRISTENNAILKRLAATRPATNPVAP